MAKEQEVCFIISEMDKSRRRRKKIQPVWLNKRQLEAMMLIFYNGDMPWSGARAKTWHELKEKRLVVKLHKGSRFYLAALSEDGQLLAKYIHDARLWLVCGRLRFALARLLGGLADMVSPGNHHDTFAFFAASCFAAPEPSVKVEDVRTVEVTFNLEGIQEALIEVARARAQADHPDDPIFQGVELELHADRDGDNCELTGAIITFKFKP